MYSWIYILNAQFVLSYLIEYVLFRRNNDNKKVHKTEDTSMKKNTECTALVDAAIYEDLELANTLKVTGYAMLGNWKEVFKSEGGVKTLFSCILVAMLLRLKNLAAYLVAGEAAVFGIIFDAMAFEACADYWNRAYQCSLQLSSGVREAGYILSDIGAGWSDAINKMISADTRKEDIIKWSVEVARYRDIYIMNY